MLNVDSEQEIREAVENNEYVALSYVRELLDEVDRLRELAYIGEHHFPDLTYKARLEETVRDLRETQAECAELRNYAETVGLQAVTDASETYKVVVGERDIAEAELGRVKKERDSQHSQRIVAEHRAMVAERERDELKARLAHAEADAEQAIHNEAFMERQRIGAHLRTASRAKGVLISIHSSQDIARLADDIEQGKHAQIDD